MNIRKLLELLTIGSSKTDNDAAAAINKKLSSYSVYKSTAKDIKLSDLIQLANTFGYKITLTGHAINLDLLTYMTESQGGETKTKQNNY